VTADTGAEDGATHPDKDLIAPEAVPDQLPGGSEVSEVTRGKVVEALREEHREELTRLRGELMKRVLTLQEDRKDLADRLKEQIAVTQSLERSLRDAERRIHAIYQSRTWRVGSAVRRAFRPLAPRADAFEVAMPDVPPQRPLDGPSPLIEAFPAIDPHPLSAEYRAELASPRVGDGSGIGFAVSTTNFGEGRGDLFVATGLGRYLRRRGREASYFPPENWHDTAGLEWVVAMMPGFRPSVLGAESKVVAWARNAFGEWLAHPELSSFQVILTSSPRFAEKVGEVYTGDIQLLPIGVDLELFEPPATQSSSRTGAVTTTNQWGGERDLYRALRSSPVAYPLHIYGQPAGLSPELHAHYLGPVDYFELPGIYWRAKVVLDDAHPAVIGWSAVNSRIFDSIAAGALPITNSGDGLEELGLSDVPTYSESAQLNELVGELLADDDKVRALVDHLRTVVMQRHSMEARSKRMASILTRAR
jgi:hypothetical protein